MTWDVLDIIGTIAFAVSGGLVAMEEEYDILGVIVLGMVTAFGGGIVRNLLIGIPATAIWEQGNLLKVGLLTLFIVFILPSAWIQRWRPWVIFFDAIGLSAFAIQGSLYASMMHHPVSAVLVAAMMTGIGGGMIRDLFAGRKPLVLHDEIYAAWAILIGILIGMHWIQTNDPVQLYGLFVMIVVLRMMSVYFKWRLPRRSLSGKRLPAKF
ncbi:MAG: rane protein [Bacilli bacterium]|nr:rane protein [Bacilli bacterium]